MKPDDTTFLEKDLKTQHEPKSISPSWSSLFGLLRSGDVAMMLEQKSFRVESPEIGWLDGKTVTFYQIHQVGQGDDAIPLYSMSIKEETPKRDDFFLFIPLTSIRCASIHRQIMNGEYSKGDGEIWYKQKKSGASDQAVLEGYFKYPKERNAKTFSFIAL